MGIVDSIMALIGQRPRPADARDAKIAERQRKELNKARDRFQEQLREFQDVVRDRIGTNGHG